MAVRRITIMPDYGNAPWAWSRLFPSSCSVASEGFGPNIGDFFGLPGIGLSVELQAAFSDWAVRFENGAHSSDFDWPSFHAEGLALAQQLKAEVGDRFEIVYSKPVEDPGYVSDNPESAYSQDVRVELSDPASARPELPLTCVSLTFRRVDHSRMDLEVGLSGQKSLTISLIKERGDLHQLASAVNALPGANGAMRFTVGAGPERVSLNLLPCDDGERGVIDELTIEREVAATSRFGHARTLPVPLALCRTQRTQFLEEFLRAWDALIEVIDPDSDWLKYPSELLWDPEAGDILPTADVATLRTYLEELAKRSIVAPSM